MTENSYRVCAVFTLKDQECKKRFIEFANGENGLSVTRAAKGCQSLNMFESREDEMKLIIWQKTCERSAIHLLVGLVIEQLLQVFHRVLLFGLELLH